MKCGVCKKYKQEEEMVPFGVLEPTLSKVE